MFLPWEFKLILSSYVNYLIKESKSFNPVIGGAILLRDNLIIIDNTYEKLESETDSFFIGWKTSVGTMSILSHDIVNHIVDYAFDYPTLTIKDKILRTLKSR